MAGHSKWANIRHRKGRVDAQRGKIFTRVSKEIMSAVKQGGSDPKANARLRLALEKARAANVPKDNIERLIHKAEDTSTAGFDEVLYELYGHGGVGLLVSIVTDNKNRIASDIRIATNKRGGNVATVGAVLHNFEYRGMIEVPGVSIDNDLFMELVLENGALDVESEEGSSIVTTEPTDLYRMKETLTSKGFAVKEAELVYLPKHTIECSAEDQEANLALIEWLEGIDDVDSVYHNMG